MNFRSVYERIAGSDPYKKTDKRLKVISWSVITLSAVSTAYVNGFSHRDNIGVWGAVGLAVLTFFIVEGSLFTIEEGMRHAFKGGTQRMLAWLCKWIIKVTMILNGAYLCTIIAGVTPPPELLFWNHWAFAVHLGVGLVLIAMIRDADPVIASRMLRLKAETAQEDQIITRMATAIGAPFALIGARTRGFFDNLALGWKLWRNKEGFKPATYVDNLNVLAHDAFQFVEGQPAQVSGSPVAALPTASPQTVTAPVNGHRP